MQRVILNGGWYFKKGLSYTKNDVRQPPVTSVRRLKSIYRSAVEVMLDYKE